MRIFLCILFFLIPLVWSKYLNANYLSAKTFLLYFAASLALFGLPERLNIRRIPKACALLLVLIFCYYVGYYLVDPQYRYFPHLFKMLSFVFVALYIYSLRIKSSEIFKKTTYPFFLMWALILGFTGYEVFNLRVLEMNIKTDIILSTFGNINMFSEFAILSLPLLFLWTRHKDRIPQVLKLGFLGFLTFLIFYGRSRSAWMGLAMWVVFKAFQGLKKREWAALAAGLGLFLLSHFTANTDSISKFQPTAFSERASLYHASAEMLWDHPFGIGIGQFVNEIVPYLLNKPSGPNEYAYFDQPHSEFLKWGIQFGWPMLLLSLAFFALILFEILRRYRNSLATPMQERGLFLEFYLMLIPQVCFQFPFENPASVLLIAVVFGLFLSSFERGRSVRLRYVKPFLGVLAVAGIVNSFLFLNSIVLESLYPKSPDLMDIACRTYPADFRTCYWKNRDLLDIKNIPAFLNQFKSDYMENPFFCDNLRLLPEYFNYQKNTKKTCEALRLYEFIYRNQKNFTAATLDNCKAVELPFKFESPVQFNNDFRNWFVK